MKVFKATREDMTCDMGQGTFRYELGKTYTAVNAKCGSVGLHSCEYVLGCMSYYPLDGKNRFFRAEAAGDIHEVGGADTRVSSTELTLVEELSLMKICYEALAYMIQHTGRNWKADGPGLSVKENIVRAGYSDRKPFLGIARGYEPVASGKLGSVLGFAHESGGEIQGAKIIPIDGIYYFPNVEYQLTAAGVLIRREVVE